MTNLLYILGFILMVVGALYTVSEFISVLEKFFPYLRALKAKTWNTVADVIKVRSLERKAIASGIEFALNRSVQDLQSELPSGWLNWARIKWVRNPKSSELQENELILRIRPEDDDDRNYLNAIYYFFSSSLFPKTQRVLPTNVKKAVSLYLTKRTMDANQPYLKQKFEREFVESHENEDISVAGYFGDFEKIDNFGFFNSAFIREIDTLADSLRFSLERENIEKEIRAILDHLKMFRPKNDLLQRDWYRTLYATSYGFILVAKPTKIRYEGTGPYIRRAEQRQRNGIQRLYLLGRSDERDFFVDVLSEIMNSCAYTVTETFTLYRDYRKKPNGVGALLLIDEEKSLVPANIKSLLRAVDKIEKKRVEQTKLPTPAPLTAREVQLKEQIQVICLRYGGENGGSILLSQLGDKLRKENPSFDVSHYGFKNFNSLLTHLGGFDIRLVGRGRDYVIPTKGDHQSIDEEKALDPANIESLLKPVDKIAEKQTEYASLPIVSPVIATEAKLKEQIQSICLRYGRENDGSILLSLLGRKLRHENPLFNVSHYGFKNFQSLLSHLGGFNIGRDETGGGRDYVTPIVDDQMDGSTSLTPLQARTGPETLSEITNYLKSIVAALADRDGWVNLVHVGNKLRQDYPAFDPKRFDCDKLTKLVIKTDAFYVEREGMFPSEKVFIKIR